MQGKPRCRVLLVEDEVMIAMMVEDMILELGMEVVGPAPNMKEALSLAKTTEFDVAILDVNVGGEVVFPVADLLRERGIPITFATGYGVSGLPSRYSDCASLPKPFTISSLAAALDVALADQPCHTEAA